MVDERAQNEVGGRLKLHALLARLLAIWSYRGKVYLAAFTGVHVPLASLVVYAAFGSPALIGDSRLLTLLSIALAATLFGTVATIYALLALLKPVSLISRVLREYVEVGKISWLPFDPRGSQEGRLLSHDHLTGVYNRCGCEYRLEEDMARVRRGQSETHKRRLQPPGRGRVPAPRCGRDRGQHPPWRMAGPVGRRRVCAGTVGCEVHDPEHQRVHRQRTT